MYMLRALVILLVVAIVLYVARRAWLEVLRLRVGAVPEGVEVPDVTMVPDRGWQVTRFVDRDEATVRVEHPVDGVRRTWKIHLREPGAQRQLEQAMHDAGRLARTLALS